ncbi:MAG: sigma-70 family RNA polymerase sigma factor [Pseudomonadota bacterium]
MAADTTLEGVDFTALTQENYDSILKSVANVADAEDALQTVFERLLRNPRPVNRNYLLTAVRNASVDIWRAGSRRSGYEFDFANSSSPFDETTPAQALQGQQILEALIAAMDERSTLDQELFERRCLNGDAIHKIAADLKLHRSTVEKRLQKIKRYCYDALGPLLDSS